MSRRSGETGQLALEVEEPLVFLAVDRRGEVVDVVDVEQAGGWNQAALWCRLAVKHADEQHERAAREHQPVPTGPGSRGQALPARLTSPKSPVEAGSRAGRQARPQAAAKRCP